MQAFTFHALFWLFKAIESFHTTSTLHLSATPNLNPLTSRKHWSMPATKDLWNIEQSIICFFYRRSFVEEVSHRTCSFTSLSVSGEVYYMGLCEKECWGARCNHLNYFSVWRQRSYFEIPNINTNSWQQLFCAQETIGNDICARGLFNKSVEHFSHAKLAISVHLMRLNFSITTVGKVKVQTFLVIE